VRKLIKNKWVKPSLIIACGSEAVLLLQHAAGNAKKKQTNKQTKNQNNILGSHGSWKMEARGVFTYKILPKA